MSGNPHQTTPKPKQKMDARVRRTRDRLGDAMVDLIQEKPFDSITVQDVLDRAGVGVRLSMCIIATKPICF
jgi:AcrR family transcriptional regulator